ncbi:MAG: aldehyde ferredoxin oxidoreductase family protein [Desulfobacterales bacterium]|nr:aldehyde ferredoxin oxidoreductase family protein [Desulfobacterales bacterium]
MASIYKGYMGKVLDINLSTKRICEYPLSDNDRKLFLGGRFLSTKILWDELKPNIAPLSPDNIIIVMTSPLTGTGAPSSSRYDISAKSPQTGAIGHSNSGGNFGIRLKKAGWDGILIRGKAEHPVYIDIDEDQVQIKNASHLWGLNTEKTRESFNKRGSMVIGPAGEHLVKYASVVSQERVHGRTGMGAVMGSKYLKAIVVNGNQKIDVANREQFHQTIKNWVKLIKDHPATGYIVPKYGTAGFLKQLSQKNALPTKNFLYATYKDADKISGETLAKDHLIRNYGCVSCPIKCGRLVEVDGKTVKGPEYEILCTMGSNLLINDIEAIIRWNYELDLLGMDTITVGNVLGFAAELNEKGMWKNDIEFGKKENISQVLHDIAYRQGIGNDLAEGVKYLSEKYGGKEFAAHVKGLEISAYEPRAATGHALGYATSNRGACHLHGGYLIYLEVSGPINLEPLHLRSKPAWTIINQNILSAISAGGNCIFTAWTGIPTIAFRISNRMVLRLIQLILTGLFPVVDIFLRLPPSLMKFHLTLVPHSLALSLATGINMYFGDFFLAGARGYTLEKLFNLREGIGKQEDQLPSRFTDVPLDKHNPKSKVNLNAMLPKYYRLRGWDEQGIPTPYTLEKLSLGFLKKFTMKN